MENKVLQINIGTNSNLKQIYEDFINFLDNEVKSISFLPLELLRHIKDGIAWTNQKGTKIDQILQTKQNISISNIQTYRPTRANVRFFLYHFFGFSLFSEERQSTVNFGTITEPEKHITKKL